MIKKRLLLTLTLIAINIALSAQTLTAISTKWNNSVAEWTIYAEADESEMEGTLKQRWQMKDDWTIWDYDIEGERGNISMPMSNNTSQWEVRDYEHNIITCRTKWNNDFTEWRITDNNITLTLKTRRNNNGNEWIVMEKEYGSFELYTNYNNDPRDWVIVDELDEQISLSMKMALVFIPILQVFLK